MQAGLEIVMILHLGHNLIVTMKIITYYCSRLFRLGSAGDNAPPPHPKEHYKGSLTAGGALVPRGPILAGKPTHTTDLEFSPVECQGLPGPSKGIAPCGLISFILKILESKKEHHKREI